MVNLVNIELSKLHHLTFHKNHEAHLSFSFFFSWIEYSNYRDSFYPITITETQKFIFLNGYQLVCCCWWCGVLLCCCVQCDDGRVLKQWESRSLPLWHDMLHHWQALVVVLLEFAHSVWNIQCVIDAMTKYCFVILGEHNSSTFIRYGALT